MTSVVIIDDQVMVRDGLRLLLELAGFDVLGDASDGAAGVDLVLSVRPDVALMDIRMPHTDGIEATRQIVAAGLPTRVLVLTTFDLDEHVYDALRAGAAGFLLKDAGSERLVAAINETAAGETPVAGAVLGKLIAHFVDRPPLQVTRSTQVDALSAREREVLALVGEGRSNAEIADDLFITLATVKSHVRHILAKLALRDRVQAVVLAHQLGMAGARRAKREG